jgi:hypothetical protein
MLLYYTGAGTEMGYSFQKFATASFSRSSTVEGILHGGRDFACFGFAPLHGMYRNLGRFMKPG